ncbi:DUF3373 domain-containing protein [Geobacter sulfurreducens]|uniref:DUF3373 domain-containing protein n=1 Tax=Geobacter sulfurreducens (strain ATCC 51573 / DSM 12127 / PCA) TaxID=243231 RepID=Q74B43_GEOSL|nr:DUF3373 domain-containing protein [Geobacter sulfurreducens]AAR35575.1 protein of unknown function DUF3373 [Geobacter sulfurreducens PCA]AJY68437.1 hypothetical protein RW64_01940 [Geobacter sulfurreducens]UAC02917.1 DUF3373 family protein [Geobacter sulfurreducens]HBB69498.1 DUF3373 domain-containing protein [Geobacter sulfurreducens]HCD94962.1 DUF3373 domain-containing protein [Geobacter sulfurreducens]
MKRMSKKVLAAALLLGLSQPFSVMAADTDLQKKMESLEKELEALKQQMQDTDKKVDKVEQKSLGRWLTISGDYRFRVDSLKGKIVDHASGPVFGQTYMARLLAGDTPNVAQATAFAASQQAGQGYKPKNDSLMTHRFGLNLKAKATKDVSVTARLLMYKTAGAQDDDAVTPGYFADRTGVFDGTLGHIPSDGRLAVDRAYATWSNIGDEPIWFSVGRRPSTGGVPTHLKENREKPDSSGTPALLVDYAFDGMTVGWAPDLEALPGAYAKICYGRGFENGFTGKNVNNSLHDTDMLGVQIIPYDTDALSIFFQYNRGFNIFDFPKMTSSAFGDTAPSTDLGAIDWYGLNFLGKVKNIGIGNFNWFVSGAISDAQPNKNVSVAAGNLGLMNGTFLGQQDASSFKDRTGWAVYAGGRYDIESTGTKLGFEYNHGSKNWITFAPSADDMWTSKVGTRGNAYEGYIIQELKLQPISSYLSKVFFKLGYQYYDFEYTGSNNWVGAPQKIADIKASDLQLMAPVKYAQDIYATFEVHF